jgi:hypothetical protein
MKSKLQQQTNTTGHMQTPFELNIIIDSDENGYGASPGSLSMLQKAKS